MTPFGDTLDQLLDERGWTQDQLSEATEPNVSQGQISNYKKGRRNPSRETVRTLARAFVSGVGADESEPRYRRTVNRLMDAAGFRKDFPDDDSREIVYEPAAERIAEAYKGANDDGRRLLEAAAEAVEKAFSRDSIGKRVRDDD